MELLAHVVISLALGLIAALIAAGIFDQETGTAAMVGLVVFAAYWGVVVFVEGDAF